MRRLLGYAGFGLLSLIICVSYGVAQKCVLKVGAWESFPEEGTKDGGGLLMRKATITEFTSTAVNQKSRKLNKGIYLMGYTYYENIPEGVYRVTIRKAGFKTTVQDVNFTCDYASNGSYFEDILVSRGSTKETVANKPVKVMRLDRMTTLGSSDSDTSNRAPARKTISGGVLNGNATYLPAPGYPPAAKAVRASGTVSVEVLIDEIGNVVSAKAVGGSYIDVTTVERKNGAHPLLVSASESAALQAKFSRTLLDGKPVKVSGVITYNFVP